MATLHFWLFLPEAWLIAGILLVVLELFEGSMIALPIGVAALIVAGIVKAQAMLWFGDIVLLETWRDVLLCFALLAVASVGLIRLVFQRRRNKQPDDINDY